MITVYWAATQSNQLTAKEPAPLASYLAKKFPETQRNQPHVFMKCPAHTDNIKNTFTLSSNITYNFSIKDVENSSIEYGDFPENFENTVNIRSMKDKLFGFNPLYRIFYTDEPSLEMSGYINPYHQSNAFARDCYYISGTFDIGKWFRPLDMTFMMRDGVMDFSIKDDDIYAYVQFHTKQQIKFKQFFFTPKIEEYMAAGTSLTSYKWLKSLKNYYKLPSLKKQIMAEIKANLLDS
tara:strand:+ start:402 stop:1109 length:708 start_codon:yes stop_codon:yes gene_type:complete